MKIFQTVFVCGVVACAQLLISTQALCQTSATLYQPTEEEIKRVQDRADGLRAIGEPGWEGGYAVLALEHYKKGEYQEAISRLITIELEGSNCLERFLAVKRAVETITQLQFTDHKLADTLRLQYSLAIKPRLLQAPITAEALPGDCLKFFWYDLNKAVDLWLKHDEGAAEEVANRLFEIAPLFQDAERSATVRSEAHGILEWISQRRGKYNDAIFHHDQCLALMPRGGFDPGTLAEYLELAANVRVSYIAKGNPKSPAARDALSARVAFLRSDRTQPWLKRAELFYDLCPLLKIESMENERIDGLMDFIQTAPASQSEEESTYVVSMLSSLQGAKAYGRPDATLFTYDKLIERATDQAVRDIHTRERNEFLERLNR